MSALPPARRTPLWRALTEAAADGRFVLQVCERCRKVQYPPREVCGGCLSDALSWQQVDPRGRLSSWTGIHASLEPYFRERAPTRIGSVQLDCGPVVLALLTDDGLASGARVRIDNELNESGQSTLVARAEND